jgi:hypothetical protein
MKTKEEIDIELVKRDWLHLKTIRNETPATALAAVSINGHALQFVTCHTPEIVLAAVLQNHFAIMHTNNQTQEASLAAVSKSGYILKHITNQTPEIALAAVTQNGYAIRHVQDETPEIAKAAVVGYPAVIEFVKNQTHELSLNAVSRDGILLKHIRNQTPEIVFAAVLNTGMSILYANEVSESLVLAAWKNVGDDLLNLAAEGGLNKVIEILIDHQINIEHISSNQPLSAFHCAVQCTNIAAMILLYDSGANVNAKFEDGRNILHHFIEGTYNLDPDVNIQVITTLLEMGVNAREVDKHGKTAMILAENYPEVKDVINAFEIKKLVESTIKKENVTVKNIRNNF